MGNGMAEDRAYMAELVKRAQQKDSDAFAELYAMTYESQYAFSRKYLRDDDYAQDALQEVYILALKNIGNLKEPPYFSTWLRQINFRICYDISMKRKKQNVSGENELEVIADRSVASNPEEALLKRLEREDLEKALGMLSVKERNAVVLKWMVNMSLDDIAGYMGCSVSSVSRYLSKGKKKLRNVLGGGVLYRRFLIWWVRTIVALQQRLFFLIGKTLLRFLIHALDSRKHGRIFLVI